MVNPSPAQKAEYKSKGNPSPAQKAEYKSNTLPSASSHNKELLRVKALKILDFFPDELVICEKTISVIRKDLWSAYTQTMPVRDIIEVGLTNAGALASLVMYSIAPGHQLEIKNLSLEKAEKAKEVIDGLLLQNPNKSPR
ncbi:MAG: hypothetical protein M1365_07830 [Actinobacteria bacterium]|nr:hypothetical protein [Actinomycetota bacterium]